MRTARPIEEAAGEQLPTSPCYLMLPEAGKGLQWIASAKREWRLPDGKPAIEAIASAAGVNWQNIFKLKRAPATPPANKTMARLVKAGAAAHGVPRHRAQELLFWFFDPEDPGDVDRLTSYLSDGSQLQASAL